jgi:DNA polymerase-3 subunit gamma/tau
MFRALLREQEDLAWAPEPSAVLEMAIVRLATMPPGDDVAQLLGRIDALERRLSGEASGTPGSGSGGALKLEAPPAPAASPRRAESKGEPAGTTDSESRADPPEDPSPPLPAVYDRLRALARESDRILFAALDGGRIVAAEEGRIEIELATLVATRRLESRIGDLEEVCQRLFGRPTQVTLATREEAGPGPDDSPGKDRARRQRKEALRHPNVNQALEILGGEIVEIRPLGGDR